MSFKQKPSGDVALWNGDPNCDAAQEFLRDWLRKNAPNYPTAWTKEDTRTQGNLGETIAFCVGAFIGHVGGQDLRCFAANAFNPFSGISRSEIDLFWVGFANSAADDFAIHQEVKTTYGTTYHMRRVFFKITKRPSAKNQGSGSTLICRQSNPSCSMSIIVQTWPHASTRCRQLRHIMLTA
jgi:hypothetical protein